MFPFIPALLVLVLAAPALLTPSTSHELQVRGQRTPRDTKQDFIKVVISEGCTTQSDSSDVSQGGKEIDLSPGSPLVLTHKIKLVPSGSGAGSGSCGCEGDFSALRERLESLEREVSGLREKCGGAEGGCCTSKESKGAGCSIKPETDECPNECSDQGRCVDGKCVCFPGFSGPDCSESNCPDNCNNNGRCVNGQCECDPGFSGPDCSQSGCPDNCNNRGRCVNGRCVCDSGFTGPGCSDASCPGNCNNRGRCVNGQCVCNPGFSGPDCSKKACPDNCNDRGRCVNGKCVCDSGFTGPSCSDESCPGNCNNRGRCVNGQCVCNPGFTGPDCSKKACPDNCNDRGKCVNGKCVCDRGFTGADCSEVACPGNCNNRGRCINGECVCDDGFSGPDCSEKTCPNDCNDRGRCVNGKCVCDSGFTGDDCSENSCPGNCNNRGRCVNGQCICNDGFTGADCSEKACLNNCSNRGKCVNGKCVCDVGFAGPDCTAKGCPSNCNNKGRCVKGKCVCRRGFTGPDCSQCEEGMTGPNCDTVMSGVSQLSTRDITETSVTLVWTPPSVQYETYDITFTSQKEMEKITAQVAGSLTTFTQTGLAAGQEYTVSVAGEINGRRGAETSTEFMTLISGPTNLQVVKTTSTSAVVRWEQSQGEIERYRLTITPSDGAGRSQEMTVPVGQSSAHIQQLEAGRLYDVVLVAEKGTSRSEPATTQVTPATMAALKMPVTLAPGQDAGDRDQEFNPIPDRQGRREDGSESDSVKVGGIDGNNRDPTASVIARTKPLASRKMAINGTRPKPAERSPLYRKPNVPGPFRFNTTRVVPGGRKFGTGPLKKLPVGEKKKKAPIVPKKPKPGVPTIGDRTIALTVRDPHVVVSSTERTDAKNPAIMSGTDSDTNRQSSSEEPTVAAGSKEQPDVGMAGRGNDTTPVSSEPTGTVQSQEKKCVNKVKVTHVRLPLKDRGNGCRGGGTVLVEKTPGSRQGSSETDDTSDLKPSSAETDIDYSQDPLHKLLTDTFDSLNITTFAVHLSKTSDISDNAETVRKQILGGLKPLSSFPSWSSSLSTSQSISTSDSSSSSSQSSEAPSSSLPSSSSSQVSSSSVAVPSSSLTDLVSLSSSSPSPPSILPSLSPSPSSSHASSGSAGNDEPDVEHSKSMTDVTSPEDRKLQPSGKGVPLFRRTPGKSGYIRRPRPNIGLFQNKTHLNLRAPLHSRPHLNLIPGRETETKHTSTSELLSSSASEESSSVEVNASVMVTSGDVDGATILASSGVEQNQEKMPTERVRIPVRRLPPNGGYLRRPSPNFGLLQNQTRPNRRLLPPPSRPLNPATETWKEQVSPTEFPAHSSPSVSRESYTADGTGSTGEENEDRFGTRISTSSMSTEFNQTLRESGVPSSHHPTTKDGYFRRPLHGGRFQNKTRTNLRPPQHPHRGPLRKPVPIRKLNGGSVINVGSPTRQLEKVSTPEITDNQSGEQGTPMPTQGVQIGQSGGQDTAEVIQSAQTDGHDTAVRPQINELEGRDNAPGQTTKTGEVENRTVDSDFDPDIHKERVDAGKNTGATSRGSPPIKQISSDSRHGEPRPVTLPKRPPTINTGEENEDRVETRISTSSVSTEFNQTLKGSGVPSSHHPTTKDGYFRRPLHGGRFQNKTRTNLRPAQHPHRGPLRKPVPTRKLNGGSGINVGSPTRQLEKARTPEITDNQSGEQGAPMPTQGVQIRQSGGQDTEEVNPSAVIPQPNELEGGDNTLVLTTKTGEGEIRTLDSEFDSDIRKERVDTAQDTGATSRGSPTRHGGPRPGSPPKRPPTSTQMRHYISGSQRREGTKTNNTTKSLFDHKTEQTEKAHSKPLTGSDVSSGVTREPLDYVGVTNRTSDGFTLIWDSPEDKYRNFVVTRKEVEGPKQKESKKGQKEEQEDSEKEGGSEGKEPKNQPTKERESENGGSEDENRVSESVFTQVPRIQSSTTAKPSTGTDKSFKKLVPGSARSFQFENLPPQTEYTVTLLGKGPGLLSRLHKLVISTGPEPPTDIAFSKVTENSLTVSWTKPKTAISGFKVTYTHTEDGEPVSVSVDSAGSTLGLSQLSPGSSYEVSVISILGLDESDPIRDFVTTLPDPPTDLRAINVTDTKALLLWRPALAAVDKYVIVYGSGTDSELKVTVSGNAAEQLLSGLEGSTTYTVTITSQLGSQESSPATTTFTTTGGSGRDGDGPRDLQANNVTPRTALLSWKPPSNFVGSYRLTYQTEGQEMKEVIVGASITEYNLTRLHPGSKYTVQLQAEGGGRYTAAISTDFTTGTLRFPFPTDCSQELLNGIRTSGEVEIFPRGKLGTPMMVYCDMETDGGGWTVFQRRKDGSEDFFRGWKEYSKGFGDLSGEFWLGLESLHNLTAMTRMSLRIDLRDKDESVFAKYSTFEVAKRNYRLTVGGYSGTAGDSLSYHNNRIFTTKDRDPVSFITRCAMSYRGGWWYKNCHEANLNGLYGTNVNHQGVIWTSWKGKDFSIPFTEMKMRPAAFRG